MKGFTDDHVPPPPTLAEQLEGTMFDQPDLRGMVRRDDHDTSIQAALTVLPHVGKGVFRVMALLVEYPGGLTDYELADRSGLQQNSIGKRRGDARAVGLVEETDERRPGPTGSLCIVWQLTAKGRAAWTRNSLPTG